MLLSDLVIPQAVVCGLKTPTKPQTLATLAGLLARQVGLDERKVLDVILEREKLGSTAIGGGIAIPHGKLAGIRRIVLGFAQLAAPNDFDALDGQPVDLVVMMLAPPDAGVEHLKALASVSRLMRDRALVAKLRGCYTSEALTALLTADAQTTQAA
jgi:PTS system nitrogen regulatory IIA component